MCTTAPFASVWWVVGHFLFDLSYVLMVRGSSFLCLYMLLHVFHLRHVLCFWLPWLIVGYHFAYSLLSPFMWFAGIFVALGRVAYCSWCFVLWVEFVCFCRLLFALFVFHFAPFVFCNVVYLDVLFAFSVLAKCSCIHCVHLSSVCVVLRHVFLLHLLRIMRSVLIFDAFLGFLIVSERFRVIAVIRFL